MGPRSLALVALLAATLVHAQTPAPAIDVDARALQPGEMLVVTVTAPAAASQLIVRAFDRTVSGYRVDDRRWRALVGVDLDAKPGPYVLAVDLGSTKATKEIVVQPKSFPTRRLKVNPDFVTPPPSAAERIAQENKLLDATYRAANPARLWTTAFVKPVEDPANSAFGTRSIFNGQRRNAHGGADFLSPAGRPIHAPNAGLVVIARDLYYSGNTVIIDHGLGLFSLLAHLSAFDVKEGDRVAAGDVIGKVGASGRVTGPHLHWAIRANGARVDPLSLLALLGGT